MGKPKITCRDVHPGDRVFVESWASLDGLPRECTVRLMAKGYWIPEEKPLMKLSYDIIKKIL